MAKWSAVGGQLGGCLSFGVYGFVFVFIVFCPMGDQSPKHAGDLVWAVGGYNRVHLSRPDIKPGLQISKRIDHFKAVIDILCIFDRKSIRAAHGRYYIKQYVRTA